MIKELGWQTLEERRRLNCLTMFYKIHSNLVAIDITNYLEPKNHLIPTRTENTQAYCIPHSSKDYHRLSFFPHTVRDWNLLADTTARAPSLVAFKKTINN